MSLKYRILITIHGRCLQVGRNHVQDASAVFVAAAGGRISLVEQTPTKSLL